MGLETIAEHTEKIKEVGRLLGRDGSIQAIRLGLYDLDPDLFRHNYEDEYTIALYWKRDSVLWLWIHVDKQSEVQWEFFTDVERNQLQLLRYIYAGLFNVQHTKYKNEG
jgi:hypothetical protein